MEQAAPTASLESIFGNMEGFDVQAAFTEAIDGVASDEALALEEKVARVSNIIQQADSEEFKEFVDMCELAAQIEFICDHDHSLGDLFAEDETVGSLLETFREDTAGDRSPSSQESFLEKWKKKQAEAKKRREEEAKKRKASAAKRAA